MAWGGSGWSGGTSHARRTDILFVFIGDGKEKPALVERAHREKLNNCLFVDPMPKKALAGFCAGAQNVGLMILDNVPAF